MKTLCVAIALGLFSLNFISRDSVEEQQLRISEFERILKSSQSIVAVDSVRTNAIERTVAIIGRFNSEMSSEMKYRLADEIYNMSVKYPNLDVDLICATITHESGRTWDPKAVSRAGAMGLMQIMPPTGRWLAQYEGIDYTSDEEILFNPIYNIRMGTRYLSYLIHAYDLEGGLAAYNGGWKRVELWLANDRADEMLYRETRNYVPFVLKLYDEFKGVTL